MSTNSRLIACPTCRAPRIQFCVDSGGNPTERCHQARVDAARKEPPITPAQFDALRRLHVDPTSALEPIVRKTLLRRGLITSPDPRASPWPHRRAKPPKRRHPLTYAGREAIGIHDDDTCAECGDILVDNEEGQPTCTCCGRPGEKPSSSVIGFGGAP